jgi:pimeloyl-ACP methyl ester carboxylesterase
MSKIEVGGLSIHYERRGDGVPLVLLHGLPGDSRIWAHQLQSLSDRHTVIAWDAPGCGRSSDPDGPFGLGDVARYLALFVGELALERPHVLGLSWGGGLALELYRTEPSVPRSLTIASGYAGWAGSLPPDEVRTRLDAYGDAALISPREVLRAWAPSWFSSTASPELLERAIELGSGFHPDVLASLARSFAETDLRPMLSSIDVPTLLLYGDEDTRAPMSVARALHASISGSQLVVIPGAGHATNLEAPEAFDDAVNAFLASVDG